MEEFLRKRGVSNSSIKALKDDHVDEFAVLGMTAEALNKYLPAIGDCYALITYVKNGQTKTNVYNDTFSSPNRSQDSTASSPRVQPSRRDFTPSSLNGLSPRVQPSPRDFTPSSPNGLFPMHSVHSTPTPSPALHHHLLALKSKQEYYVDNLKRKLGAMNKCSDSGNKKLKVLQELHWKLKFVNDNIKIVTHRNGGGKRFVEVTPGITLGKILNEGVKKFFPHGMLPDKTSLNEFEISLVDNRNIAFPLAMKLADYETESGSINDKMYILTAEKEKDLSERDNSFFDTEDQDPASPGYVSAAEEGVTSDNELGNRPIDDDNSASFESQTRRAIALSLREQDEQAAAADDNSSSDEDVERGVATAMAISRAQFFRRPFNTSSSASSSSNVIQVENSAASASEETPLDIFNVENTGRAAGETHPSSAVEIAPSAGDTTDRNEILSSSSIAEAENLDAVNGETVRAEILRCTACLVQDITHVVVPCGHGVCGSCVVKLKVGGRPPERCHVCRSENVIDIFKIYA